MKELTSLLIASAILLAIGSSLAKHEAYPANRRPMEAKDADEKPTGTVKFFFASQKSPTVIVKRETYVARPRANAMSKSDEKAWPLGVSRYVSRVGKSAQQLGTNAVVISSAITRKTRCRSRRSLNAMPGLIGVDSGGT